MTVDDQPFAGVEARGSVDYALRTMKQELIALVGQSDTKASILITACSIAITGALIGSTRTWGGALLTMAGFAAVSMFLAILAVVPKSSPPPPSAAQANLLFFGHFRQLPKDDYVARLGELCRSDAELYAAIAGDIWVLGAHLERAKYRYLRVAYGMFMLGAVAALAVQVAHDVL